MRFFGIGGLVFAGLVAASVFRISTVVQEDRLKAGVYFLAAFLLGLVYMWGAAREPGSPWVQDPQKPGNHRFWRLILAGVIVPLLDAALAGGMLLIAAGFVSSLIVWVCMATIGRIRHSTPGGGTLLG
ncbi:MAG: hypothetical protein GEU71_03145 [Actinobacteria bacterium]|nr:hypothetical protein [Actinomycetota bacterium]